MNELASAICIASFRVSDANPAGGTTRFTSPQSAAVAASIARPVSSISIARFRPTARVSATIGVVQNSPILTPAVDELLIQDAFNLHKPILAICQGTQALNVWCGGTLYQDLPTQVGATINHAPDRTILEAHPLQITPHTRLSALIPQTPICHPERSEGPAFKAIHHTNGSAIQLREEPGHLYVNSSHHQAIHRSGDNLIVSAISPQDKVIEAVELASPDHWVIAVQWHPERTYNQSTFSRALFHAFVQAAQQWTPRKIEESVLQA